MDNIEEDMQSSEGGSFLNLSSEEQVGGNIMSDMFMLGSFVFCCTTLVMSVIMIFVINAGNYCKNRGGKKK